MTMASGLVAGGSFVIRDCRFNLRRGRRRAYWLRFALISPAIFFVANIYCRWLSGTVNLSRFEQLEEAVFIPVAEQRCFFCPPSHE